MEPTLDELIARHFPEKEGEIRAYADFLKGAGIERGLIGPREGDRIWERHILNSLFVCQLLPQGASLFDIGSGAGLPGIVIALSRPDLKVTLIEPLERRVEFLKEATAGTEIQVIRGRAQDVKKSADYVTARAVAALDKLKEMEAVPGSILHEITLEGIGLGRVVELKKLPKVQPNPVL